MAKFEEALRSTVVRLIRRELRATVKPLSLEVRELKRVVSPLRKTVSALEKLAAQQVRRQQAELAELKAPAEEVKKARFSPALLRSLRARLGITQSQLASLVGVSAGAVTSWEAGRMAPRGRNRAALVALRKLRRSDAKRLLAEKSATHSVPRASRTRPQGGKRKSR